MKKIILVQLGFFLLLMGCSGECKMKSELELTQQELEATKQALAEAEAKTDAGQVLVHTVYFDLKDELKREEVDAFVEILKQLEQIDYIKSVQVGTPADTKDPRLVTNYEAALLMEFANETDLEKYQKDEFHLKQRAATAAYLAGPPVVYDYFAD
jgi:hypothetical protein